MPITSDSTPVVRLTDTLSDLPEDVLLYLLRNTSTETLWSLLTQPAHHNLLAALTRGFQRTAKNLRLAVIQSRWVAQLRQHPQLLAPLLDLWANEQPAAPQAVAALEDEELCAQLSVLWLRLGPAPLLLALLAAERETALEAYTALDPTTVENQAAEIATECADATETAPGDSGILATFDAADSTSEACPPTAAAPEARLKQTTKLKPVSAAAAAAAAAAATATSAAPVAGGQARLRRDESSRQLEKLVAAHARELRVLGQQLKHETHRVTVAEAALAEARKGADRTSRRQRHAEREAEEAAALNKTLRRQLRQAQQLHEELRKQNAALQARLPQAEPAACQPTAKPGRATSPVASVPVGARVTALDQVFVWKSDGRAFRVSPREVGRAIDSNDEETVFSLIQAFECLREMNSDGYKLFLERIRGLGRYYVRVLTADTTRVLVDASNVARFEKDKAGKGRLRHLLAMRSELRLRDCFPVILVADASLIYNIDEPGELAAMARRGEIEIVAPGTEADEILAREARRSGAYVVTNDRNFHLKVTPDFEPPRISFRIYEGSVIVDDF